MQVTGLSKNDIRRIGSANVADVTAPVMSGLLECRVERNGRGGGYQAVPASTGFPKREMVPNGRGGGNQMVPVSKGLRQARN